MTRISTYGQLNATLTTSCANSHMRCPVPVFVQA